MTILSPGTDPASRFIVPNQAQVAASAITAADGSYATSPGVAPGNYPFIVVAAGYRATGGNLDLTVGGFLPDVALSHIE